MKAMQCHPNSLTFLSKCHILHLHPFLRFKIYYYCPNPVIQSTNMDQKFIETEHKLKLCAGDTVASVGSMLDEKTGQSHKLLRFGLVSRNANYNRFAGKTATEIQEALALDPSIAQNGLSQSLGRVLWKQKSQKSDLDLSKKYLIMNRKFNLGQRVTNGRGHQGEVIGMKEFAIVQVVSTDKVIRQEVPVDRLVPASPLFCGVQVEHLGWIGQVTGVDRAFRVECIGKPATVTVVKEPIKNVVKRQCNNGLGWSVQIDRQYPFTAKTSRAEGNPSRVLYYGTIHQKPNTIMMNDRLNEGPAWANIRNLLENPSNSPSKVTHSRVDCISVTWLKKIPSLEGSDEKPPPNLTKSSLEQLKSFWVQPNQYIYKNGICLYQKRPEDEIVSLAELHTRVWEAIEKKWTKFTDPFEENGSKAPGRKKDRPNPNNPPLAVHALVMRTSYKIKWDHAAVPHNHFGDELEALDEPSNITFPFVYAKKVGCNDDNIYGVVRGRVNDKFRLQWLTINSTAAAVEHWLSEESFQDITSHTDFNRLRVGTLVYVDAKSKFEKFETSGFVYGTVKEVNRHFFGKVLVHCAKDNCQKWLWPFQLNIITIDYSPGS